MSDLSFDSLDLVPELIQVVKELGFQQLTPIQAQCIPKILAGSDVLGQAKTGSGKTAAFAIPILQKIYQDADPRACKVLILSPTRELCTQIAREVRKLGRHFDGLRVLEVVGGQPIRSQIDALEQGVDIVVATPGRVMDLISRDSFPMQSLKVITLDEADRMLEMGFIDDIEQILGQAPADRQTLMFSATFSDVIKRLATKFQKQAEWVMAESHGEEHGEAVTDAKIAQSYFQSAGDVLDSKTELLIQVLSELQPASCVVFCNFKVHVADVNKMLLDVGIISAALHGDLEQPERDRVMAQFRNQSIRVLVATDVAARGIHVDDVELVINYDVPKQSEIYVHRIGRTGRLQTEGVKEGVAVTLILPQERPKVAWLEKECKVTLSERSLSVPGAAPVPMPAPMRTLFISGGRKDKVRPGDILGALTGEAGGFQGTDIGKIEIHDFFSYVAVKSAIAAQALKSLQAGRMKGRKFRVEYLKG